MEGELLLNFSPNGYRCTPVAPTHSDCRTFPDLVPVPKGKINTLLCSTGGERVDVRGVVTEIAPS